MPMSTQEPSDRRGVKQLEGIAELAAGWRRLQLTYFHTGQEPKFSCEMEGPQFARRPIPSLTRSELDGLRNESGITVPNDSVPLDRH